MPSRESLVRIRFWLDPTAWHGNASERLYAKVLDANRYEIRNVPFYVRDVSFKDVVLAERKRGELVFTKIATRGGHSTYRLFLLTKLTAPAFEQNWKPLADAGCTFEEGDVLAVDVPPDADIYAVYRNLEAGEKAGVWDFEEGHCGHALIE